VITAAYKRLRWSYSDDVMLAYSENNIH